MTETYEGPATFSIDGQSVEVSASLDAVGSGSWGGSLEFPTGDSDEIFAEAFDNPGGPATLTVQGVEAVVVLGSASPGRAEITGGGPAPF